MTTVRLPAKSRYRKGLETDVKRQICDALTLLGIEWWRMNSGVVKVKHGFLHCAKKGTADILASAFFAEHDRPAFLWIEVKKPDGEQSKEQVDFECERSIRHHFYWLVASVDELLAQIKLFGVTGR